MNRSLGLGVAALLIAGIALWWWGSRGTPPPMAQPGESEAETYARQPETETETESEPPERTATQPAAEAPAAQAPAPDPAAQEAPAADPPTAVPEAPSEPLGPVARLKHAFEVDPVDPQAIAAERELRALFGGPVVPVEMLERVRCRKRACKLELVWLPDEPFAYHGLGVQISTTINPDMAVEPRKTDAKGVLHYDVYVARDGYEPGDFEPVPEPAKP
jgi:hypothetical protein